MHEIQIAGLGSTTFGHHKRLTTQDLAVSDTLFESGCPDLRFLHSMGESVG